MRRLLTLAASRLDDLVARLRRHPGAARAVVAALALMSWAGVIGLTWFSVNLVRSTPRRGELGHVGEMAQATRLLASDGGPAFTIFKEQRIEVPLSQVSPLLVKASPVDRGSALLRASRGGPDSHRRLGAGEPAGRSTRAGRKHDYAATRATKLPHARQDAAPEAAGSHRRGGAGVGVLEGSDPRAVPEQGVLRRRAARRRSRVSRVLRQARLRARRSAKRRSSPAS